MRITILHGEAHHICLPLKGHKASLSTALNGQKPFEIPGALIKHARTGPGLCTVKTKSKDFMITLAKQSELLIFLGDRISREEK